MSPFEDLIRKNIVSRKEHFQNVEEQVVTANKFASFAVDVPDMEEHVALLQRRHMFMQIMVPTFAKQDDHGGVAVLGLARISLQDFIHQTKEGCQKECRDLQFEIAKVVIWRDRTRSSTPDIASSDGGHAGPSATVPKKMVGSKELDECSKVVATLGTEAPWRYKLAFTQFLGMSRS